MKYAVAVSRSGPGSLRLTLGGASVEAVVRRLNDGGLLIQVPTPYTHPGAASGRGPPRGVTGHTWGVRPPNAA